MSSYPYGKMRSRPPEYVQPFERMRIVGNLMDIPSGSLCTWVPAPTWLASFTSFSRKHGITGQPWLTQGLALKFANSFCPVGRRHR